MQCKMLSNLAAKRKYAKENLNRQDVIAGNLEFVSEYQDVNMKEHISACNKVPRRIPNILKNSARLNRSFEVDEEQTKCSFTNISSVEQNRQIPVTADDLSEDTLAENLLIKKRNKCKRLSQRRKQKHHFVDVRHELPKWSTCSSIDGDEETLGAKIRVPTTLRASARGTGLKCCRKRNRKQEVAVIESNEKEDLPASESQNISLDLDPEYGTSSSSSKDFPDTVDFSSNEIFHKFNYEFYGNNSSNCSSWYMADSDEVHDPFNATLDSDIYEMKYDINGNEIDTCKTAVDWPLNEEMKEGRNISESESLMPSELLSEDTSLSSEQKSQDVSNSYCDYCFEDCVSNWLATEQEQNRMYIKHELLPDIRSEDAETNLDCSDTRTANCETDLTEGTLKGVDIKEESSIIDKEEFSECLDGIDSPLTVLINDPTDGNMRTGRSEDIELTELEEECNLIGDPSIEVDFDGILELLGKQTENSSDTELSEVEGKKKTRGEKKDTKHGCGLQCLLCPLTFSNTHTMAMHQAGAHGDRYIILCESCGRLFNRKYHFNRHLVQCTRLNELFKCDMCAKKYRYKSSLVHHFKVHHRVHYSHNHSNTFTCNICNKVYSKYGFLENHIKIHNGRSTW